MGPYGSMLFHGILVQLTMMPFRAQSNMEIPHGGYHAILMGFWAGVFAS